jgi:ubiquinone/menaquinone biosynthesis C-methylase UbiE
MPEASVAFVGSVPANYDRYMGPIFFHHYADDLAERLVVTDGMRVLETACGTGILTRRLLDRLGGRGSLVATDLNQAMIDHARALVTAPGVEWQPADATRLPVPERSFDAVVCQFGLMFFPDKASGIREAHRVLKPGGQYLFNVWDALEHNPVARVTHETVATFFPTDAPSFYTVPFGYHDIGLIEGFLTRAGFREIHHEAVEKTGTSPSAPDAAIGLIEGSPILAEITSRRAGAIPEIKAALAKNIAAQFGDRPARFRLRALVFSARRS